MQGLSKRIDYLSDLCLWSGLVLAASYGSDDSKQ